MRQLLELQGQAKLPEVGPRFTPLHILACWWEVCSCTPSQAVFVWGTATLGCALPPLGWSRWDVGGRAVPTLAGTAVDVHAFSIVWWCMPVLSLMSLNG